VVLQKKFLFILSVPYYKICRTAQEKEYSLDKETTTYDDTSDALRLSVNEYEIDV